MVNHPKNQHKQLDIYMYNIHMDFVETPIVNHQLSIIILIKISYDWLILYGKPIIM